jgi:hypothetical protein
MTFWKETEKPLKRRWMCFVCGISHETYEKFKCHITENHEEGREFLKCPTCDSVVRDLRQHFAAKHPNRLLPKGIQLRVGVWSDFAPSGKKKTRKPTFHSGEYESRKNGSMIRYRSGMERDFYEQLEADLDVIAFHAEPFKVPYFYQGKWHDYIPDLRIDYLDGATEIWEIKPANQTDYEQNKCKWAAMNNHAKSMGWNFTVQTEVALGKLKTKIKRQRLNETSSQTSS